MTKLICRNIPETDHYYFTPADGPHKDTLLFTVFTDDLDLLFGKDTYNDLLSEITNNEKAELHLWATVCSK